MDDIGRVARTSWDSPRFELWTATRWRCFQQHEHYQFVRTDWPFKMSSRCHGFVILVARILDYFGFADAGLVFNLFMVIFMALGCNLEGIICQPAIWAQGELSVTRKALVLRVASGELAKHRPILDLGGAIGIFCVWWVSLYTVMIWWWWYILYIYIYVFQTSF